jgi:hypothetical protein
MARRRDELRQESISFRLGDDPKFDEVLNGCKVVRSWQKKGHAKLSGKRYGRVSAVTGSGKSLLIRLLAHDALASDATLRVIIAVPQLPIADSFGDVTIQHPRTKKKVAWIISPTNMLTDGNDTVNRLVAFIESAPHQDWRQRVVVCSHATLVAAHNRLKDRWNAHGEVMVAFDESHHSRDGENGSASKAGSANACCQVLRDWFDISIGPLLLSSATWMRGDFRNILPPEMLAEFEAYNLPAWEYLEQMAFLREIHIRFLVGDELAALRQVFSEEARPSIFFMPYLEHPSVRAAGGKLNALERYKRAIGKRRPQMLWDRRDNTGEFEAFNIGGEEETIAIDLVTDEDDLGVKFYQPRRAAYGVLKDAIDEDNAIVDAAKAAVDARGIKDDEKKRRAVVAEVRRRQAQRATVLPSILFCQNMGKEGFDCAPLARAIVMGERGSMVELLQILGRIIRDYPGKEIAELIIILPFKGKPKPEQILSYSKFMLRCMLVEDALERPELSEEEFEIIDRLGPDGIAKVVDQVIRAQEQGAKDPMEKGTRHLPSKDRATVRKHVEQMLSRKARRLARLGKAISYTPDMKAEELLESLRSYAFSIFGVTAKEVAGQLGHLPVVTPEYVDRLLILNRCKYFQEKGQYVDPRTIPGVVKYFGSKKALDEACRAEGL